MSFNRDPAGTGGYYEETIATFTCNPSHSLYGDDLITCQTSGTWNQQIPTCTGNEMKFSQRYILFSIFKICKKCKWVCKNIFCSILFNSNAGKWHCKF